MRHRRLVQSVEQWKGSTGPAGEETKKVAAAGRGQKRRLFCLAAGVVIFFLVWGRHGSRTDSDSDLLPLQLASDAYNVFACPEIPPRGYPREYPILNVLNNWNTAQVEPKTRVIYQGICVFDAAQVKTQSEVAKMHQQIQNYRAKEVPFIVRGDPAVRRAVDLWNTPNYLLDKLQHKKFLATRSNQTLMTYYSLDKDYNEIPDNFSPLTYTAPMSYEEWYHRSLDKRHENDDHAYLRLDACLKEKSCDSTFRGNPHRIDNADFMYQDLDFFYPGHSHYYEIDVNKSRGIQCRFGTALLTAECHFDNERNYIAMLRGTRRYLLSHPKNCPTLALYPQKHPLERHTQIDWRTLSTQNRYALQHFPNFSQSTVNEVVLQAGDVLYLPTYWFHHIISLSQQNIQCNTRSGYSVEYDQAIYDCGFFYDFPD